MRRRTLLAAIGAGTASLAGCTGRGDPGTPPGTDDPTGTPTPDRDTPTPTPELPTECPVSQDLGVEWPENLDSAAAAESFVEAYERVYYREEVVEYEPETSLDSYGLHGSVSDPPERVGDGWRVTYSGSGGVYRPTLHLAATAAEPPADADVVPASEVEDERLADLLAAAAETGDAETVVERDDPEEIERYAELLPSLSADFEPLGGKGDSDSLYVDVDGTGVKLTATASSFHGDYWWTATYYVDERVVRRAEGDDADPLEGELLECRLPG